MQQINAFVLNFDACPMNQEMHQNLSLHALDLSHFTRKSKNPVNL